MYTTVQIRNVDHRGILFSHKATYTGIRYSMDGPQKRYAKWQEPITTTHVLYDSIHMKRPWLENL